MAFTKFESKRYEAVARRFVEKHRPPVHVRKQLDLRFRMSGQSVELFEVRPHWKNPNETLENPVAKTTYVKTQEVWKLYWQRADLRWHRYDPVPEVETLEEALDAVKDDRYGCFFG